MNKPKSSGKQFKQLCVLEVFWVFCQLNECVFFKQSHSNLGSGAQSAAESHIIKGLSLHSCLGSHLLAGFSASTAHEPVWELQGTAPFP